MVKGPPHILPNGPNKLVHLVMTITQNLDTFQHGARAIRRGIRFPVFAIELLVLRKVEGMTPVLCSRGWSGLTLRLWGRATIALLQNGSTVHSSSKRIELSRRHEFNHVGVIGRGVAFLEIRFGRRSNRSRVVEVQGDQVSSVPIEKVARRRLKEYDKVIVSSTEDQPGPTGLDA